jgi:hypothetical protein
MLHLNAFQGLRLVGGFTLRQVELNPEPMLDPIGRYALAKTRILGREFYISILSSLSDEEISVTLYHEVLEAMVVASTNPPAILWDFNEGDFERAAHETYRRFGTASQESLVSMLQFYDFREE